MAPTLTERTDLLTVAEAAQFYPMIPGGTWRYFIHLRRIASYKVGRRRLLRRADVEAFIERHRQEASS